MDIIVVGHRIKYQESGGAIFGAYLEQGSGAEPHPTLGPTGPEGGGTTYIEEPKECPVDDPPHGVALADLHAAAAAATKAIEQTGNDRQWEYGVIIFELDGMVGFTPPFTQQSEDYIDWNPGLPSIPNGARVLALLHNHPRNEGRVRDFYPTTNDWRAYESFQTWSGPSRAISVDPNALNYVATRAPNSPRTFVYDKNDKGTTVQGCSLQ